MEEGDGGDEGKLSKFNSQILILRRINNLWNDCHSHARHSQLIQWSKDLDRVWCELVDDAQTKDHETFKSFFKKVELCYEKDENGDVIVNNQKLYPVLLDKEVFLRQLQNKQGKSGAYKENDEDYMDG